MKIYLASNNPGECHASSSFISEFLRLIKGSSFVSTDGPFDCDVLFVNRSDTLAKIDVGSINYNTRVILWAHGLDDFNPVNRCDDVGFTSKAAVEIKGGFHLEYGVCPYPTSNLRNPYGPGPNIFYAGRILPHTEPYMNIASRMGNLYVIGNHKPPSGIRCTYLGPLAHGSFVEYYLYADASFDVGHQSDRTYMNCKPLDCIYYGLPVVAPGPFGGDHWIIESECGIVTEERNLAQFKEALKTVLDDPWKFRFKQPRLNQSLTWEECFKRCPITAPWM